MVHPHARGFRGLTHLSHYKINLIPFPSNKIQLNYMNYLATLKSQIVLIFAFRSFFFKECKILLLYHQSNSKVS